MPFSTQQPDSPPMVTSPSNLSLELVDAWHEWFDHTEQGQGVQLLGFHIQEKLTELSEILHQPECAPEPSSIRRLFFTIFQAGYKAKTQELSISCRFLRWLGLR